MKESRANKVKERIVRRKTRSVGLRSAPVSSLTSSDRSKADAAVAEIFAKFGKDSNSFTLKKKIAVDRDPKGRLYSKLGGTPYWPANMAWPTSKGKPMMLFAQINLAEMPRLPNFPISGMLQFFCVNDDWYNSTSTGITRTIYHKTIDPRIQQLQVIPKSTCDEAYNNYPETMPFNGVLYIDKFTRERNIVQTSNTGFDATMNIFRKYFGSRAEKEIWQYSSPVWRYIDDLLAQHPAWGHRIGGWHYNIQNDPSNFTYDTMLLQVDSDKDIMWGDCGIGNIFINFNSLVRRDFSDTMYYWDCG